MLRKPYLVSVCMPIYNGEEYLAEALESIVSQTYRPLEVIVSDDNSKDNSLSIIKEFASRTDIPFHIYHHDQSSIGANWNHCIKKATGEYIKFVFQDDTMDPSCIEELVNVSQQNENIGLAFCKRRVLFDPNNENHVSWVAKYGNLHKSFDNLKPVQHGSTMLRSKNLLDTPKNKVGEPIAVLFRKDVFNNIGYFNTGLEQSLDYELYYRVFTKYKVAFVDKSLASFRLHEKQATVLNKSKKICDYQMYPKLMYKNCFWFLHPEVRIRLLMRYNRFSLIIRKYWQFV